MEYNKIKQTKYKCLNCNFEIKSINKIDAYWQHKKEKPLCKGHIRNEKWCKNE